VSRLASALRMAATTLRESDSYLGAQFRRLRTTLGRQKRLRPWRPNWGDWCTACSGTGKNTRTEHSLYEESTANNKSIISERRLLNMASPSFPC
jgi:hypothetical protein